MGMRCFIDSDYIEQQAKTIIKQTREIDRLKKVVQVQADSFAAIENENCALRSKLNRIRELAERLDDGAHDA